MAEVVILLMIHMFEYVFPDKVKYMNVKVFKLMSSVNEIRFLVLLKSCQCKCTLTESGYNSKQKWNHDECRHECK